jgi:uncharacterized damage-inducible protein DinB
MTDDRIPPIFDGDERAILYSWLDWHRETLAAKCAGLSQEQLRMRAVPPSELSLLGLVRHLAHVERAWFRRILDDEDVPLLHGKEERPDADFEDVDDASAEETFATWRAEIELSRKVSAALPLDAIAKRQRAGNDVSHRRILVHLIQEYARHNGHADLLRQRIDGTTGE